MFIQVATRSEARKAAPWAEVIAKVSGGFIAFKFVEEYETWKRQR